MSITSLPQHVPVQCQSLLPSHFHQEPRQLRLQIDLYTHKATYLHSEHICIECVLLYILRMCSLTYLYTYKATYLHISALNVYIYIYIYTYMYKVYIYIYIYIHIYKVTYLHLSDLNEI
jgi:hypothetical protein